MTRTFFLSMCFPLPSFDDEPLSALGRFSSRLLESRVTSGGFLIISTISTCSFRSAICSADSSCCGVRDGHIGQVRRGPDNRGRLTRPGPVLWEPSLLGQTVGDAGQHNNGPGQAGPSRAEPTLSRAFGAVTRQWENTSRRPGGVFIWL